MDHPIDLLLINPGGREQIYQSLGGELTAVEPPLWCRLIGGYVRDRGYRTATLTSKPGGWPRRAWLIRLADLGRAWWRWWCSDISLQPRRSKWWERGRFVRRSRRSRPKFPSLS